MSLRAMSSTDSLEHIYIVSWHRTEYCGGSGESGTIGLYRSFDEARMALRESANKEDVASEVYENSFVGSEKNRKQCIQALREGREGSEAQFTFSLWGDDKTSSWTEKWDEKEGTASIEIAEEKDGQGCPWTRMSLSIEPKKISKITR